MSTLLGNAAARLAVRSGFRSLVHLGFWAAIALSAVVPKPALALPSFAIQTGQPCAACHIGAFGPQLTPYGRDFKLHGYTANDGQNHGLPIALTTQTSFTHTLQPQPGGAAPGFKPNDNFAIDQLSLYYAGKIAPKLGGFMELNYDGVAQQASLNNVDIRYVDEGEWLGQDVLWGITANNNPTVQDPWNSTPAWGFPYNRSALAPTPTASTLVDGLLGQRVTGLGFYTLWNDTLYLEGDVYKGLSAPAMRMLGQTPEDSDQTTTFLPYARVAFTKDWADKRSHGEIGAYAMSANVVSGADPTFGLTIRKTDWAVDANYQYITDPDRVTSDRLSAHATYIHETTKMGLDAQLASGAFGEHWLDTMRFDVSYSFAATVTPSFQYFRTAGSADLNYWSTPNGSPNSDGFIFEVAYVPWGKPDSPFPNMNVRLAAQYINYLTFDGTAVNASRNSHFYFSLWTAVKF